MLTKTHNRMHINSKYTNILYKDHTKYKHLYILHIHTYYIYAQKYLHSYIDEESIYRILLSRRLSIKQ